MSSFFNQVGNLGQTLGQTFGQTFTQSFQQTNIQPEEIRIRNHQVIVKERLAEGGFGVIDLVIEPHSQRELALKRCNIDRPSSFEIVKKEVNLLRKFTGPYVVKLIDNDIGERDGRREALLLMEYYPGGHLLDRLNSRHGSFLPAEAIYRIFGQILLGIQAFHENHPPIIHRDIKLENVLFGPDGKVRLCDFGSCVESPIYLRNITEREQADEIIQRETTPMYRAPEMADLYMREILTEKSDIWALGCVFFALTFLKHPFQDVGSLAIIAGKYTIPKDSPLTEDGHVFLKRMLDIDPEARPTVAELLEMVVELAAGRPLPPYQLTEEAIKRREARLEADKVRECKNKKKAAPAPPPRKGQPPSSNSVAAKRLAAKRGHLPSDSTETSPQALDEDLFQAAPALSPPSTVGSASAATTGAAVAIAATPLVVSSFDPFDDSDNAVVVPRSSLKRPSFSSPTDSIAPPAAAPATVLVDSKHDVFDPFGESGSGAAAASKPSTAASLFGSVEEDEDDGIGAFRTSASSTGGPRRPSFETSHSHTVSTGGFDPFAEPDTINFDASHPSSVAGFDAFGSKPLPAVTTTTAKPAPSAQPSQTFHTFDAFGQDSEEEEEQEESQRQSASGGFEAFHDTFDPFAAPSSSSAPHAPTVPTATQETTSILDFGDEPSAKSFAAADLFDPFGGATPTASGSSNRPTKPLPSAHAKAQPQLASQPLVDMQSPVDTVVSSSARNSLSVSSSTFTPPLQSGSRTANTTDDLLDAFGSITPSTSATSTASATKPIQPVAATVHPAPPAPPFAAAFTSAPAPSVTASSGAPLLDIFSSDILQPLPAAPAIAPPSITRGSSGGGLSAAGLDLLSLYDHPPTTPSKPVMLSPRAYGVPTTFPMSPAGVMGGSIPMMSPPPAMAAFPPQAMGGTGLSGGMGTGMAMNMNLSGNNNRWSVPQSQQGPLSAPFTTTNNNNYIANQQRLNLNSDPSSSYGRGGMAGGVGGGVGVGGSIGGLSSGKALDPFDSINVLKK
eukprot:gene800-868_t